MTSPSHSGSEHVQSAWLWVMCLTGVDYFSTLGYQPTIAFKNAGLLAPLATVVLVFVTLAGALPVYGYVARQSSSGQGSIGMLAHMVHGWRGKFLVLVLLGFAATDFVITKTLSAADAAAHLVHNPLVAHHFRWHYATIVVTGILLVLLGAMFFRGFREVIGFAVVIVAIYLVMNAIVIGAGVSYLIKHPELIEAWWASVTAGDWRLENPPLAGHGLLTIALVSVLLFPKMALGLSGFETGVAVMPLVKGDSHDDPSEPLGRIRNTRKLLITSAIIMSVLLLGSAMVVSALVDPSAMAAGDEERGIAPGKAYDRALAYLAHGEGGHVLCGWFGVQFGTVYDISTIVILWFAGASAMSGLLNLVPQYLPKYGMAPEWAGAIRPLVFLFTGINLLVTVIFKADVEAQGGAYATGVMVLISSACVATVIDKWRKNQGAWWKRTPWYFVLATMVFLFTSAVILWDKPDGIKIASCFIAAILVSSIVSRTLRSTELRFQGFEFHDEQSKFLWDSMKHLEFPVLVPHRPGRTPLALKERTIRMEHHLTNETPIVFVEVALGDTSDFYQSPIIEVKMDQGTFILKVRRCSSTSHVIAAIGLELSKVGRPPEIHFGWSDESPVAASFSFLLFGQGNVPWMVRELILKAQPNPALQPKVIVG